MKTLSKQFTISFRLQHSANKTRPIQVLLNLGTKHEGKYLRAIAPAGITLKPNEWNNSKSRPVDSSLNLKLNILEDVVMKEVHEFQKLNTETIIRMHAEGFFKKLLLDNIDEILHDNKSRSESLFEEYSVDFPVDKNTAWFFEKKAQHLNIRLVDSKGNIISPESFFHNEKKSGSSTAPEGHNPTIQTMTLLAAAVKEVKGKISSQALVQGEKAKYKLPADCVLFSDFVMLVAEKKLLEGDLKDDAMYTTLKNRIEEYHSKFPLANYDDEFATNFIDYVKKNSKAKSTLGNYTKTLKAVVNFAQIRYKILKDCESRDSAYQKIQEAVRKPYLTFQQLEVLQQMELTGDFEMARDMALISAHTGGNRFSNWSQYFQLQTRNVKGKMVHFVEAKSNKTGERKEIPVQPFIASIIKKYNGSFPELQDGTFNANIREVCKQAGKIDPSFLSDFVYQRTNLSTGKAEDVKVQDEKGNLVYPKLYSELGSHAFRRSFVTNYHHDLGIELDVLREFTGQTLKTCASYCHADSKKKVEKFMEQVPGFSN